MSTAAQPRTAGDEGYDDASSRGAGWAMFAAILLFLAGTWNVIDGVLAMSRSHVYTADAHYVFSDLKTWGWIVVLLGSSWAVWFAIAVTVVNAIGQLMFVPAYPFWALTMFTLDVLIIFGLATYNSTIKSLKA